MRYINLRLTYLLTYVAVSIEYRNVTDIQTELLYQYRELLLKNHKRQQQHTELTMLYSFGATLRCAADADSLLLAAAHYLDHPPTRTCHRLAERV